MQRKQNIYRHLDITTEDDNIESHNTQNEQRKALKKLREINLLDQKESLSKEEEKKVQMKGHWERILNPLPSSSFYENKQPDEECKQKQQARHLLKEKKRQKEKEKQEKINQEREQKEKQKREREQQREKEKQEKIKQEKQEREEKIKREREEQQKREREEQQKREREEQQKREREEQQKREREEQQKRQREEQQKRQQEKPKKPSNNLYDLKKEFGELLQQYGGNVNRVFRLLSRKYHPDKNSGTKNSVENQQMLSVIRDQYLQ